MLKSDFINTIAEGVDSSVESDLGKGIEVETESPGERVEIGDGRYARAVVEEGYSLGLDELNHFLDGKLEFNENNTRVEELYIRTTDGHILKIGSDGGVVDTRSEFKIPEHIKFYRGIEIGQSFCYRIDSGSLELSTHAPSVSEIIAVGGEKGSTSAASLRSSIIDDYTFLLENTNKQVDWEGNVYDLRYKPFNPLLEFGVCFEVPEDVVDPSERRKLIRSQLEIYEKKLIEQKIGIGKSVDMFFELVNRLPDLSFHGYSKVRNIFAAKYLLTEEQVSYFDQGFWSYRNKHKAVEYYRQEYPDDSDLFEVCFGDRPEGRVEVTKGPMTLHFRCEDARDFIFLNSYHSNRGDREKITANDKKQALKSGGFTTTSPFSKTDLSGTITVERGDESERPIQFLGLEYTLLDFKRSESIQKHEEQHLFNKLFRPYENKYISEEVMENALKRSRSPKEIQKLIIHDLVEYERRDSTDYMARDEILAYYKDGTQVQDILEIILGSDLYNFRKNQPWIGLQTVGVVKDHVEGFLNRSHNLGLNEKRFRIRDSDIKKQVNRVFGEEYRKDLKIWVEAISILEKKGLTREEILNLLYQEPVNSWINLARRMKDRA